jgi:hypothetical protein
MTLSFPSQFGYYNLRVNPTLEQVAGTVRKPLRIELPDRKAKWYALSPYRALILDAEQKFNQSESAGIEYRNSGAELPESAARARPSEAAGDHSFRRIEENHHAINAQNAYETAQHVIEQKKRYRIRQKRSATLSAQSGPNHMNPVVEAHSRSLAETGMPHIVPGERPRAPSGSYPAPHPLLAAAGQPQAEEFPAFELLNMGQPANVLAATLSQNENLTYEQVRDFVVQPTWLS